MAFLGQEEEIRTLQDRFKYCYLSLFIVFIIIISRLIFLQIFMGETMRQYSEENRIKRVLIPAPRGMIFDRNKILLVDNHPSFDLEITPQYLKESGNASHVIRRISKLIETSPKKIRSILKKNKYQPSFIPVKIKTDLSRDEVAKLETWKMDMPGVSVKTEMERTNLFGDIGSHLLGYISRVNSRELPRLQKEGKNYHLGDTLGKSGIEKNFEEILRGEDGEELVEVDALGRKIRKTTQSKVIHSKQRPAVPGKNIILTIDQNLQMAAVKAFENKVGSLVAIDPRSGQILAMVSRPSFDSTEFSRGISSELWKQLINNPHHPLRNKAVQDHYSPGSAFKPLIAIAAMEENLITPSTVLNCPSSIRVGRKVFHDHRKGGFGNINIEEALKVSSNVFFYRVAQRFETVDTIAKWARAFGLGQETGVELDLEVPGLVPTEEWKLKRTGVPWTKGETLNVGIGHSFLLTTAIQLANMYAAISNGGTLYKPYVVDSIENPDGKILKKFDPSIIRQIKMADKTLETVRRGLWKVVNEEHGTAYWRRLPNYEFSGKTGTVLITRLSEEKLFSRCESFPEHLRHHGIFAGYAPSDNPEIAIAVIAEHACSGSAGAAPIAREVFKTFLENKKILAQGEHEKP